MVETLEDWIQAEGATESLHIYTFLFLFFIYNNVSVMKNSTHVMLLRRAGSAAHSECVCVCVFGCSCTCVFALTRAVACFFHSNCVCGIHSIYLQLNN